MKIMQINSSKLVVLLFAFCLLCSLVFFAGCNRTLKAESINPSETYHSLTGDYEIEPKDKEDNVRNATNIVTAKYVETVQTFQGNEYAYEVKEELKGSMNCTTFYVITVDYVEDSSLMPVKGDNVILYLSKYSSVYYEHDKYILMDIEDDTESERCVIQEISCESNDTEIESGHVFTRSKDMSDILAVTESIFLVTPQEVYVVGVTAPTTTYTCTVQATIKGKPEFSEILITFFNDTVTVGDSYLVLLADHHEGGRIYTLSSPYSVFTKDEALQSIELKPLLEKAQNISAPDLPTEGEVYTGEQSRITGHS